MVSVFSLENLIDHLKQAAENLDDIHFYHFSEAMMEFSNSFSFLGRALSMAFSDISTKAQAIEKNFKNSPNPGLQSMILGEVERGVQRNNSEEGPSTARTVLRLLWFFDFLKDMITNVMENEKWKLSKSCSKAYDSALAPHHPWHVRLAAGLGIKTVPSKKEYMDRLLGRDKTLEEQMGLFKMMLDYSAPIRETLWGFYHQHRLTDLP